MRTKEQLDSIQAVVAAVIKAVELDFVDFEYLFSTLVGDMMDGRSVADQRFILGCIRASLDTLEMFVTDPPLLKSDVSA